MSKFRVSSSSTLILLLIHFFKVFFLIAVEICWRKKINWSKLNQKKYEGKNSTISVTFLYLNRIVLYFVTENAEHYLLTRYHCLPCNLSVTIFPGLPEPEPPFLAGAGAEFLVRLRLLLLLLLLLTGL